MAGGQDYSKYQKKIINRYYEHQDTIQTTKLSELVTDLYLCEDAKKADKLWQRAALALEKFDPRWRARIDKVLAAKNIEALAKLVNELAVGGQIKGK